MGYYRAGFTDITGIDNRPMPRYPFEFIQADALEYLAKHGHEYDVIHASPPCQRYSEITPVDRRDDHPDLIGPVRELLRKIGNPYVIENVRGARDYLENPLMLCGSMFGLGVRRHRFFEIHPETIYFTLACNHSKRPVYLNGCGHVRRGEKKPKSVRLASEAMKIDWMIFDELREAIPPAYTEFIGHQLLTALERLP